MSQFIFVLCGWIGSIGILVAYFLVSSKKVRPDSYVYQIINLIAAILLIINAWSFKVWWFVGLNCFWFFVALKFLTSLIFKKNG